MILWTKPKRMKDLKKTQTEHSCTRSVSHVRQSPGERKCERKVKLEVQSVCVANERSCAGSGTGRIAEQASRRLNPRSRDISS